MNMFLNGETSEMRSDANKAVASDYGCVKTVSCLGIFPSQLSKWGLILYSVRSDSLALLTHPETCWMQPPLFAVLPSSTAPRAVARQPTYRQLLNDRSSLVKQKC